MADDASIRILPLDGTWETLGSDRLRGIVPQGIEASSDSWGPSDMRFTLAAERGARRPDILPFTPVELEVGGLFSWSGFVWQRPSDKNNYSVGCRGWQFHLDDDLYDRVYVHTRLSEYRDQRSFLGADLTKFKASGAVGSNGGLSLVWGTGDYVEVLKNLGATIDLGPDSVGKRVVINYDVYNSTGAASHIFVAGHDGEDATTSVESFSAALATVAGPTNSTLSGTFATARRYVTIYIQRDNVTSFTVANGQELKVIVRSAQVFRDTSYEGLNVSLLKSHMVIKDALTFAPLLNQSTALITNGTFVLPSFDTNGYVTPRSQMEAADLVEFFRLKIGGEDLRTLICDPKPSAPIAEVGDWAGSQFDDATVTGEPIFNRAIIDGTGPDGARLVSKRTQTGDFATRRGFFRTARVDVSTPGTAAVFNRICDLWLAEHQAAPFTGTLTIVGAGARRPQSSRSIPPHEFLLYSGELVRFDRVDPDTGNWGRDGRIAGSTYRHDDRAVVISIDNQPHRWDEVMARYAVLVGG